MGREKRCYKRLAAGKNVRIFERLLILPELVEGLPYKCNMDVNWKWYVYIVLCEDGSYYTGMTYQLDMRWTQHLSGLGSKYTSKHKPKRVVYLEEYEDLETARRREKQIKGWRREKKEKLIRGEWIKW